MKYAGMFGDSLRDNTRRYDRRPLNDCANDVRGYDHNKTYDNSRAYENPRGYEPKENPRSTHNSMLINKYSSKMTGEGRPSGGVGGIYSNQDRHLHLDDYDRKVGSYTKVNIPGSTTHATAASYHHQPSGQHAHPLHLRDNQGSTPNISSSQAAHYSKNMYRNADPTYSKDYSRPYEAKYKYQYEPTKTFDNFIEKSIAYEPKNTIPVSRTPTASIGKETPSFYRDSQDRYERPRGKYNEEFGVNGRSKSYAREPPRELREPVRETIREPIREHLRQPTRDPREMMRQAVRQTGRQIRKPAPRDYGRQLTRQPIRELARQPMRDPREPTRQPRQITRQPTRELEMGGGGYDCGNGKQILRNLDKVQDKIRSLLKT